MFFALLLLLTITAGGFALTYLYDDDGGFFVRACAGIIIGQVLFSLIGFLLGSTIGMSGAVAALSAILSAAPLLILLNNNFKQRARADFANFSNSIKNFLFRAPILSHTVWAAVYAAFFVLVWFFFERAMLDLKDAIGTGSPHNTGDLSFHLQAIYGFLDGQNYPPQNPSFGGVKFTYPFMADLVAAMLAAAGVRISDAMFWQNVFLVVALAALMRHFTFKLTNNNFAANIAPLLLLLSGGLGFMMFFRDAAASEAGVFGFLMKMPDNYTIRFNSSWRWGNTLCVLFMTQRSLLMGMPLVLIVLTKLWETFSNSKLTKDNTDDSSSVFNFKFLILNWRVAIVGLLAGALPLVHAHSFAVLMGMAGLLATMSLRRWREWFAFFLAAAIVAIPELLWATAGSATRARSFVDWEYGWDNNNTNAVYFWLKNTGFFIPLLFAALVFLTIQIIKRKRQNRDTETDSFFILNPLALVLFWLPFVLCFVVPNAVRLAPWVWDNIKVLVYWFVVSIPLVAVFLAWIWQRGNFGKVVALALVFGLTFAGFLDVFRIASGQIEYQVFDRNAVAFANQARKILPPDAVVVSAPVHDSPAALLGRRWFLGFTGHVWSHGIDPQQREIVVRQIYFGDDDAEKLMRENNIQYIVVGPQEQHFTVVNDSYLRRFPTVAQTGAYRLLQVK